MREGTERLLKRELLTRGATVPGTGRLLPTTETGLERPERLLTTNETA